MHAYGSRTEQNTVATSEARITWTKVNFLEEEERFIPPVGHILALRENSIAKPVTIFSPSKDGWYGQVEARSSSPAMYLSR
jgi:hypothetical protein